MATKQFNKGLTFLLSLIISYLIIFLIYLFAIYATGGNIETPKDLNMILAVLIGIYAYRKRIIPSGFWDKIENDKKWKTEKYQKKIKTLPLTFPVFVYFLPWFGLPYFFYELFKTKAKIKGLDTNSKKGFLFWISFAVWLYGLYLNLKPYIEIIME